MRLGEVVEMLLDLEVGCAGGEVQSRRCRNGTADVVRGDRHVMHVRHGGDLFDLEQTATFGDVRLNDVACLQFK